ncbi:D-arabinono-1,4-lactone oxidase [Nannocystaceae bacterium ST9]
MTKAELQQHPAYLALTPEERAAVDERLKGWHLDAPAVAATTGGIDELDAGDLRFWLATTARRPWAMITLADQPATANAIFEGLLDAAPKVADRPVRAVLVDFTRAFSRALVVAEAARREVGFVRDEQLAALARQLEQLGQVEKAWEDVVVLGVIRRAGLDAIADAIVEHLRETTGMRGFLARLADRIETNVFDLVHGGVFLATGAPDHEGHFAEGIWRNWTSSYEIEPKSYGFPNSERELAEAIVAAKQLRMVGGGHSFNDSPLSPDTMLSLDAYDAVLAIDREAKTARVQAGIRLRDLNKALWEAGLGLPVLGSTDAQSLAGLIATDLHGTGRDHGFLSEQVLSLRVLAHDGSAWTVRRDEPLFHAVFGALGTCGVVAEVELQLVDAFNLVKTTMMVDRTSTERVIEEHLADHEHVSFYYVGGGDDGESIRMHCWDRTDEPPTENWQNLKTRIELGDFAISAFIPGVAKLIADVDEDAPLSNLLAPDHRLVMPGSQGFGRKLFYRHDEIEFGVPFAAWQACVGEIMQLLHDRRFFSVVEVRFTPDTSQALIGPGVGRRTAYIELATPLAQDTTEIYAAAEDIFLAHGGQPHLGKKTNVSAQQMLEIFGDRYVQFQAIRAAQDPGGKFLNPFTRRVFGPV